MENPIPEQKARIINGVRELFFSRGIKNSSMDDIAESLGMSKKTLYQHFENKDELVQAFITSIMEENVTVCDENFHRSKNAIEESISFMQLVGSLHNIMRHRFIDEVRRYHPKAYEIFAKFKADKFYEVTVRNLRNGIEQGYYRSELDVELIARIRLETLLIPFTLAEKYPQYSPLQIFKTTTTQYIYSIASEKGIALLKKNLEKLNGKV